MKRSAFIALAIAGLLFALTILAVVRAESDLTPPVLVWLTLEPTYIDTSGTAQSITARVRITDDLSGFDFGYVSLTPLYGGNT